MHPFISAFSYFQFMVELIKYFLKMQSLDTQSIDCTLAKQNVFNMYMPQNIDIYEIIKLKINMITHSTHVSYPKAFIVKV